MALKLRRAEERVVIQYPTRAASFKRLLGRNAVQKSEPEEANLADVAGGSAGVLNAVSTGWYWA